VKAVRRLGGRAVRGTLTRRGFLAAALGFLTAYPPNRLTVQDSLPGTGPSGKLWDPSRAGRPLPPVTVGDNDAAIQAIEKQLKCTCGCNQDVYTCRTTDFNCTTSPALHERVLRLAAGGRTAQEIIDQFVREHGVQILMAPPKRGFNLAGYFLPTAVILAAAALLVLALRRWTHAAPAPAPSPQPRAPQPALASSAELERLRRELDRLPG
jgi:cytochrome c-type biogenesis protein CcmH